MHHTFGLRYMEVMYQLLTVVVLAAGCLGGIRRGISGQMASVLGAAFGIGGVAVAGPMVTEWVIRTWPFLATASPLPRYLPEALSSALVYVGIYLLLLSLGPALNIIFRPLGRGAVNMVIGGVWGIAKWAMLLSLLFNVLIGLSHDSSLLKASKQGDGNLASAVMLLAPALTGTCNCDDLAYAIQMEQARAFDRNHGCGTDVR